MRPGRRGRWRSGLRAAAPAVAAALALAIAAGTALAAAGPPRSPAARPAAAFSLDRAAAYLRGQLAAGGGFAEPGEEPGAGLTAWATLALVAAGTPPGPATARYLRAQEGEIASATDLELSLIAQRALGGRVEALVARLEALVRPDGRIGPALNSTFWGALALDAAGRPVPAATAAFIRRAQGAGGGWSWHAGGRPDADDTAAALLALKAAGATARDPAVRRGLAFLARLRNPDGGTTADPGGDSNAQSTAWAIQAHRAFGLAPAPGALAYLAGLQQRDGSVRFSAAYETTPVWVTAYAVVAASGRWYPVARR